jgi:hypothetical protein
MDRSLIDKIIEASSMIHTSATRGSGNWIVTSTETADAIHEVYRQHVARHRKEKIKRIYESRKDTIG